MRLLFVISSLLYFCFQSYSQTGEAEYNKIKEYKRMLQDSLITPEDYNKLKNNLLFENEEESKEDEKQKVNSVVFLDNGKEPITKEEFDKMEAKYKVEVTKGKSLIIIGVVTHIIGSTLSIAGAVSDDTPMKIIGGTMVILDIPFIVTGAVRLGRNKSNLRKLNNDYIIVE